MTRHLDEIDWRAAKARGCDNKNPLGRNAARALADRINTDEPDRRPRTAAYRCPWAHGTHWHIGHVPSIESTQQIADALRAREIEQGRNPDLDPAGS